MKPEILIVAPYPNIRHISEGWMSRIRAIDQVFKNVPRAYINFGDHHKPKADGHAVECEENVVQYNLNAKEPAHQEIMDQLVSQAKLVYVHTVHLAINVVKWLPAGKIIVDIHGIVPEEEIMLGRPQEAKKYEPIEEMVLKYCKVLVVVTNAMKKHLMKKYPDTNSRFIVLPIYEHYQASVNGVEKKEKLNRKPKVLYSGGSQVWQNVDYMMDLAKATLPHVAFTFLSHDTAIFEEKAKKAGIREHVIIKKAAKHELPHIYREHDFGFVLRDENPVNTVSCPTKLSEYMDFGLVPVIKYKSLGDFEEMNYAYITDQEFVEFLIPDEVCRKSMISRNNAAIDRLIDRYKAGSGQLLSLIKSGL